MNTYRKQLDKFNESGLYLYKVITANEVECLFDANEIPLSEHEFEVVCDFVYNWIMNSEATAKEVVDVIIREIFDGSITFEDLENDPNKCTTIINGCF